MSSNSPVDLALFRVSVNAVIFDGSRVLLGLRRDIEWWNLPGGGVEPGEAVDAALRREVREETGLEVELERLVGVYSKPQKSEVVLAFRCRITGGELQETEETSEHSYFAPDELPTRTLPKHRQRIEDALLDRPEAVVRTQSTSTEEDQRLAEL